MFQFAIAGLGALLAYTADLAIGPIIVMDTTISHAAAAWTGFFLGLILSGICLFVVQSAIRTSIVLFAESPDEFAEAHVELHDDMKTNWEKSYPGIFQNELATPLLSGEAA